MSQFRGPASTPVSPEDLTVRSTGVGAVKKATCTPHTDWQFLTGQRAAVGRSLVTMFGMNRPSHGHLLSSPFCSDGGSNKGEIYHHEPVRQLFSCHALFNFSQENRAIDPAKQVFKAGDFVSIDFLE